METVTKCCGTCKWWHSDVASNRKEYGWCNVAPTLAKVNLPYYMTCADTKTHREEASLCKCYQPKDTRHEQD